MPDLEWRPHEGEEAQAGGAAAGKAEEMSEREN